MRRREFITLLGGSAAWPLAARAQQGERVRRVGMLLPATADDSEYPMLVNAFVRGLQQLGWTDGRNIRIDIRWAGGGADTNRRYAEELVALAPDVIMAAGNSSAGPLLKATRAIPIVFTIVPDPVGAGLVDSLARPGGNATGFTSFAYDIGGKWLELLKEIAPRVTRVAVIRDSTITAGVGQWSAIQTAAPSFGVEATPINLSNARELERTVDKLSRYDRHASCQAQTAGCVLQPRLCFGRGTDLLRFRSGRPVPERGGLRRSHPQGREAGRPSGAGADQVRTCDQPEDRQGAWPHRAAAAARPRRRGDRIEMRKPITLIENGACIAVIGLMLIA